MLDYRQDQEGDFECLVKWRGFPESQATHQAASILTADEAKEWWGPPTVVKDAIGRADGEHKMYLRWETIKQTGGMHTRNGTATH